MLTLAEKKGKTLFGKNKHSKQEKCKVNTKTRIGTLQHLKYKVLEIMTEKDEDVSFINAYIEQLEDRLSKFEAAILSLKISIQVLADNEKAKSRYR